MDPDGQADPPRYARPDRRLDPRLGIAALVVAASACFTACTPQVSDAVVVDPVHQIKDTLVQDTSGFGIPWKGDSTMGTMVDPRDGWVYRTARVGAAVWMAQNLEFRAATPDGSLLGPDSVGRCPDDSRDSCSKYGRLYSWTEAMGVPSIFSYDTVGRTPMVVGICPSGWHLPSSTEWGALQQASGGVSGGSSLKAKAGWITSGTDRLGVRFLPAGYQDGGVSHDLGTTALFWVNDEYDMVSAWNWYLYDGYGGLLRGLSGKAIRMSVRCVKG